MNRIQQPNTQAHGNPWHVQRLICRQPFISTPGKPCHPSSPTVCFALPSTRCMLDPSQGFDPSHPNIGTLLRLVFVWAFVWSVGANINDATRPKLEKWVGENFRGLVGSGSPFLKVCNRGSQCVSPPLRIWREELSEDDIVLPCIRHAQHRCAQAAGGHPLADVGQLSSTTVWGPFVGNIVPARCAPRRQGENHIYQRSRGSVK